MAAPARNPQHYESLLAAAASGGHSMMVLNTDDLARLMHQLGGGLSSGNTALGNSLHAQSQTIGVQNEQIRGLLAEVDRLSKRCSELEQQNLGIKTFDARVALAHKHLDQEARQSAEMMGLVKIAALTIAQNAMGGTLDLAALLGGGGGLSGMLAPKRPEPAPSARAAENAGAAANTNDEPDGDGLDDEGEGAMPATLGEALKAIVSRLSPETLDLVIAEAERPNPDIPGGVPTLVAILQLLLGALTKDTLDQLRSELGPEMMQALFMLLTAHTRKPSASS